MVILSIIRSVEAVHQILEKFPRASWTNFMLLFQKGNSFYHRGQDAELDKFDAPRFAPFWNEIVRNLREEDYISNAKVEKIYGGIHESISKNNIQKDLHFKNMHIVIAKLVAVLGILEYHRCQVDLKKGAVNAIQDLYEVVHHEVFSIDISGCLDDWDQINRARAEGRLSIILSGQNDPGLCVHSVITPRLFCTAWLNFRKKNEDGITTLVLSPEDLPRNEALRVAYIDEVESVKNGKPSTEYFSKLVKADIHGKDKEIYSIKLPGNPKLGEGKPENQNHAIIFTRGNAVQTIDMNQDNYFEEALKMRNLLEEFSLKRGKHHPFYSWC
ncbi:hypothetical protein HU200_001692 [Digitaria exilis]|uniref:Uncharacterized protein n=1 Tax=Digitaria exilis TaxID=1010633 RepID=A0A835KW70_9POAL|nr:hypothetical protein HU200_001692 [Digitaria exilis]